MFKEMKIRTKLLTGFILVALIAAIIGTIGVMQVKKINAADKALYETCTVPLDLCVSLIESFQRLRVNARDIILADNAEEAKEKHDRFLIISAKFDSVMTLYENTIIDEIDRKNFTELSEAKKEYVSFLPGFIKLIDAGNLTGAKI